MCRRKGGGEGQKGRRTCMISMRETHAMLFTRDQYAIVQCEEEKHVFSLFPSPPHQHDPPPLPAIHTEIHAHAHLSLIYTSFLGPLASVGIRGCWLGNKNLRSIYDILSFHTYCDIWVRRGETG